MNKKKRRRRRNDSVLLFHYTYALGGRNYSCWSYFNRTGRKRKL